MAQVWRGKKEPGVSWEGDVERLGPTMEVRRSHSNMKLEELKTQTTISLRCPGNWNLGTNRRQSSLNEVSGHQSSLETTFEKDGGSRWALSFLSQSKSLWKTCSPKVEAFIHPTSRQNPKQYTIYSASSERKQDWVPGTRQKMSAGEKEHFA